TKTRFSFTPRLLGVGALVAIQSYCLYSAVARIQVALALLVFNVHPLLFMMLTWAMRKERVHAAAIAAIAVTLPGLALVLDLRISGWEARWHELGAGVAYAFAA